MCRRGLEAIAYRYTVITAGAALNYSSKGSCANVVKLTIHYLLPTENWGLVEVLFVAVHDTQGL